MLQFSVFKETKKYNYPFGCGEIFLRPINTTNEERVYQMAWVHACPVPDIVTRPVKPGKEEQEKAYLKAIKRYTECNYVFSEVILKETDKLNPRLHQQLINPIFRISGEKPDPNLSRKFVPENFETVMSPLSTPVGYALPRIILVGSRNLDGSSSKEKTAETKKLLKEIIPNSKDSIGLTLSMAEKIINVDSRYAQKIIYHLMSADVLGEEGCVSIYREIASRMQNEAPKMFEVYRNMSKEFTREKGIIFLGDLK